MTLNITVLTRSIIYQSADFRLTDSVSHRRITDRSAKCVTLTFPSWLGLVTYCGLGKWEGRDLSSWIAEWLSGRTEISMADAAAGLAAEGTALLERVYRETRARTRMRHTFTLAGFEGSEARVSVVSNFESCVSQAAAAVAADHLTVTSRKLSNRRKALVIVTGCKGAVPMSDRRVLAQVAARSPGDSGRIRRRMQAVNAAAEGRPESGGMVSRDCVVVSFRADGSGALQLNRDAEEVPATFPHVTSGVNMADVMAMAFEALGVDLTQVRLVQGAFASSQRPGVAPVEFPRCQPVLLGVLPKGYVLSEILATDFEPMSADDVSEHGIVVGTGRLRLGAPPSVPWGSRGGEAVWLGYEGLAMAVSADGQVAAMLQGEGKQRAGLYDAAAVTEFPLFHGTPGIFAGTDTSARAINRDQWVAGMVRSQSEEVPGRTNTRAAVFRAGLAPQVLMELLEGRGSEAVAINDQGIVLVLTSPAIFDARSVLWDPQSGGWGYVGDKTTNVFPIGLTDDGAVLGQARNARSQPLAVICRAGGTWERLGTRDGWAPAGINNRGDVVGWGSIDGLDRPWLRLASGELILLPYLSEHNTIAKSINDVGDIAGSAAADHGGHALVWRL